MDTDTYRALLNMKQRWYEVYHSEVAWLGEMLGTEHPNLETVRRYVDYAWWELQAATIALEALEHAEGRV